MKHSFRINGQVLQFDFELGSGRKDKNGVEIFEGDRITANGYHYTIKYKSLIWYMIPDNPAMADLLLCWHRNYEIEVVGHIAEDKS